LIIPAYNEEHYLPRLLDSVDKARVAYSQGPETVEVIVADNGSTDDTVKVATARGCKVVQVEKRIIGAVRNGGAASARGEILAFIDADSEIHPNTFDEIDKALATGRYVAGTTGLRMERWSLGIAATYAIMVPMAILMKMDSGVVFCRRDDFETVGGYNEDRLFAEDVQFLWDLRRLGKGRKQRLVRVRTIKALGSTRKWDRHGEWHYITQVFRLAWLMFRSPSAHNKLARNYWYKDDRRDPP
jgi:glycosyltransferase involved in cell wall biosynthesis